MDNRPRRVDALWFLPSLRGAAGELSAEASPFAGAPARRYPARTLVSHPGDAPRSAFFCTAGAIKVTHVVPSGDELLVAILQRDAVWSDRALMVGYWRAVTLEAIEDATVVAIPAAAFEAYAAAAPARRRALLAALSQGMADALTLLEDFQGRDIHSRLARVLLAFARDSGVDNTTGGVRLRVPITHHDLAASIGTARETVSRAMAQFREDGLVRGGPAATLEIVDVEGLRALVG
jgi:CRP/FNR family transcriptional regulator